MNNSHAKEFLNFDVKIDKLLVNYLTGCGIWCVPWHRQTIRRRHDVTDRSGGGWHDDIGLFGFADQTTHDR